MAMIFVPKSERWRMPNGGGLRRDGDLPSLEAVGMYRTCGGCGGEYERFGASYHCPRGCWDDRTAKPPRCPSPEQIAAAVNLLRRHWGWPPVEYGALQPRMKHGSNTDETAQLSVFHPCSIRGHQSPEERSVIE